MVFLKGLFRPHVSLPMKLSHLFLFLLVPLAVSPSTLQSQTPSEATAKKGPVFLTTMVSGDQIWQATTEQFAKSFSRLGLQWLSPAKDQARFFGDYAVWDPTLKVSEAIVEFQEGKMARINLALFTRGDSAVQFDSREDFEARVEEIKSGISTHLGVQPTERGKDTQSAVKAMGWLWTKDATAYLLEYSYVREVKSRGQDFRSEFIRLRVAQVPQQQGILATDQGVPSGNSPVAKSSLAANVSREANGDVVIKTVPMVDQGPKGYCAVAATERIFRYYGLNVDQHELAQIANTSDGGGTDTIEMFEALEKIQGRMRVRVRALHKWDIKEFLDMVTGYNREARRNGKREINLPSSGVIMIGDVYGAMDPVLLKASRAERDRSGYGKFQRMVQDTIEKGVPIMWGVELGIFKEGNLPQTSGGHIRLIIGLNLQTSEILYSDSWGAAHALKRMPMDEAYTITTGMYYIEPMK